jgi:hypothetical protein
MEDGFLHAFQRRKMDNACQPGVFFENLPRFFKVAEVKLVISHPLSGYFADARQWRFVRVGEVVNGNHVKAIVNQINNGVAADVAAAACNKDFFHKYFDYLIYMEGQFAAKLGSFAVHQNFIAFEIP